MTIQAMSDAIRSEFINHFDSCTCTIDDLEIELYKDLSIFVRDGIADWEIVNNLYGVHNCGFGSYLEDGFYGSWRYTMRLYIHGELIHHSGRRVDADEVERIAIKIRTPLNSAIASQPLSIDACRHYILQFRQSLVNNAMITDAMRAELGLEPKPTLPVATSGPREIAARFAAAYKSERSHKLAADVFALIVFMCDDHVALR